MMKGFTLFNFPLWKIQLTKPHLLGLIALLIGLVYLFFNRNQTHPSLEYKVFRIGRDPTWYPLQLQGKEKKMVAFTNELLLAVAKEGGFHFEISDVHSHTLFEKLEKGEYDAVLSSLTPTQFSRQKYEFSNLFFLVGPVLVVTRDSPAKSLADMEGKIVGVQKGTSLVFNMAHYPSMLAPYEQIKEAFDHLLQDKIDGVITDLLTACDYSRGYYIQQLKILPPPLTFEGLRVVAKQGISQSYLLTHFNEGLEKVKQNGDYQKLLKKWDLAQL